MNLWTQGLPAKIFRLKIFKLNAFYLLMSFAFILYYQQVGMYRYKLIVYHLLLMQTLLASMFGMALFYPF